MQLILYTIMKMVVITLSGFAGILTQLSEAHRRLLRRKLYRFAAQIYDDRPEPRHRLHQCMSTAIQKESCTIFAIIALVVALWVQAIESRRDYTTDQQSRERFAAQISNAQALLTNTQESLNYLKQLGTRFDTLSFSVTYELDAGVQAFLPLRAFADKIDAFTNSRFGPSFAGHDLPVQAAVRLIGTQKINTLSPVEPTHSKLTRHAPTQITSFVIKDQVNFHGNNIFSPAKGFFARRCKSRCVD
jgi:hypothetical protein